ncbi:hypothetical protein D3C80_1872670 [compost metagenome]
MVPGVLMSTDLVCTMPRVLIQSQHEAIETFELPFKSEPFQLVMAWHPRDDADPANRWLRQLAQNLAASPQPAPSDANKFRYLYSGYWAWIATFEVERIIRAVAADAPVTP